MNETNLHPFVVLLFVVFVALLVISKRRRAVLAFFLFFTLFIPMGQRLALGGVNIYTMRLAIFLVLGWGILRGYLRSIRLHPIDRVFVATYLLGSLAFILLWGTWGAVINRVGYLSSILGGYFVFKMLIRDLNDVCFGVKILSFLSIILFIAMGWEQFTGRNYFSIFGDIPEYTGLRAGALRSQGPFGTAISAGMFGATFFPLAISQWWFKDTSRFYVIISGVACLFITAFSSSSGPLVALASGIGAWILFKKKNYVKYLIWLSMASLITLQFFMKAPVWALIGRLEIVSGSTSYHRFNLIDQFIRRVGEWWLFGVKSTHHWGWALGDQANQYVFIGTGGGILSLILFVLMIYRMFRTASVTVYVNRDVQHVMLAWGLGCSLFAHVVGFVGLSYWDQMTIIWGVLVVFFAQLSATNTHQNQIISVDL